MVCHGIVLKLTDTPQIVTSEKIMKCGRYFIMTKMKKFHHFIISSLTKMKKFHHFIISSLTKNFNITIFHHFIISSLIKLKNFIISSFHHWTKTILFEIYWFHKFVCTEIYCFLSFINVVFTVKSFVDPICSKITKSVGFSSFLVDKLCCFPLEHSVCRCSKLMNSVVFQVL